MLANKTSHAQKAPYQENGKLIEIRITLINKVEQQRCPFRWNQGNKKEMEDRQQK